jgi:hypothetical protein
VGVLLLLLLLAAFASLPPESQSLPRTNHHTPF